MLQAQKDGKTRKKSKGHIKLPRIQWIISRVSRRLWSWLRGRLPWRFRFGCGWRPVSQRGSVCSYFISCFKNQVLLGPSYNISEKKNFCCHLPLFVAGAVPHSTLTFLTSSDPPGCSGPLSALRSRRLSASCCTAWLRAHRRRPRLQSDLVVGAATAGVDPGVMKWAQRF